MSDKKTEKLFTKALSAVKAKKGRNLVFGTTASSKTEIIKSLMDSRSGIKAFVRAYLESALWSSHDSDGEPLDSKYSLGDFSEDAIAQAVKDCTKFRKENESDLNATGADDSQHGHDFWMTRERHGVGFWDRGYGAVGKRLTDAANAYGEVSEIYGGEDEQVHFG